MAAINPASQATPAPPAPAASKEFVTTVIHFTNGEITREAFYLKILKSSIDDETLSDLRQNIAGLTDSIEISHFPFCGKTGAIVPDSFTVQEYLTECLGLTAPQANDIVVYMRDDSISPRIEPHAGANVSAVLEADKLARIRNNVDDITFKYLTGTAAKYVPELEQKDWAVICDSNAVCYGMRVLRVKEQPQETPISPDGNQSSNLKDEDLGLPAGIERARYPAFRLRKRTILSDSIPSSSIDGVKLNLRIPDYIIDDKSYFSTFETETEMQASMAHSSFAEADVAVAGSGSYMGFSAEGSSNLSVAGSFAAKKSSQTKVKKVTIAYNFPRVTLFLDSRSLELTPECATALQSIKTKEDLHKFQDLYGEIFCTRVQLGGRLFATEQVSSNAEGKSKELAASMKVAASASFSGWGAKASMSASAAAGTNLSTDEAKKASAMSLTWQANGGDTLLCNHPTEWAPTVSYHWNWRITKQDNLLRILDLMCQLAGMSELKDAAKEWGVTIDPTAGTFLSGLIPAKSTSKAFTLNLDGVLGGRYLLSFESSGKDLSFAANARMAETNDKFTIDSNLRNRGCMVLGPNTAQNPDNLRVFEAEDVTGTLVTRLCFNTKYRVRNKNNRLYLDYHVNQGFHWAFGNPNRATSLYITLVNPEQPTSTVEIPDRTVVHVRFWDYDPITRRLGYLHVCAKDKDKKYAYLAISLPEADDKDEARLVVRYR